MPHLSQLTPLLGRVLLATADAKTAMRHEASGESDGFVASLGEEATRIGCQWWTRQAVRAGNKTYRYVH